MKEAVKLEYKMNKNEEYIYQVDVDSTREITENTEVHTEHDLLKMRMVQKVTEVLPDGSYSLDMVVEPQEFFQGGNPVPLNAPPQTVQMKMNRSGEVLWSSMPSPASQPSFPKRSIFIGESWDGESKVNLQDLEGRPLPPAVLKFKYLLWGVEKVKGYDCAKIEVTNPETHVSLGEGLTQKITASGTTYFAHGHGRLVKSEVETKISMELPQGKVKNVIKIHVDLVQAPKEVMPSAGEEFLISG